MNNAVFRKAMKNLKNIEILNLSQQKEKVMIQCQNQIIILKKKFTENLLPIEMIKTKILMNKPDYLGSSKLGFSEILMYDFGLFLT